MRTFPGRRDVGRMTLVEESPGRVRFETVLPKRYGALGSTRHGLYALGGFHPVPMVNDAVTAVDWTVEVSLPGDDLGLVGQSVGAGNLAWTGRGERVALALPRRARVWRAPGASVRVLGKGRPRRVLRKQLTAVLPTVALDRPVVLVEAPLRRRLTRHAPGVLFVSDRIFQLTWVFRPYHRPALVEGLAAADTLATHPQLRDLVGRTAALRWQAEHEGMGAVGVTNALSFVPSVDALLSSRRMAFYGETFRTWNPTDPLLDDVVEVVAPFRPGSSLAGQVEARSDRATLLRLGRAVDGGFSLAQGLQLVGLDPGLRNALTAPVPPQDYGLEPGWRVRRTTSDDAPTEMLEVRVDGELRRFEMAAGDVVELGPADRVVVDPARRSAQLSRRGDARPLERLRVVGAAGITTLNLTRFRLEGVAAAWVRGRNDDRNLVYGALSTTRSSTAALSLRYTHKFGPLRYGITRQHQLRFTLGPSLVNGRFQSLDDGRFVLSGSAGWGWTNKAAAQFPLRGQGLSATVSGGLHPGSDARWARVNVSASSVHSAHPRHAVALLATGSVSRSTRGGRLQSLAGTSGMASLPVLRACEITDDDEPCLPRALERLVGSVEYRWVAVRGARVPLIGAWGRELVLSAGLEGLAAGLRRGPASAVGAVVGVSGVYDLFGADPGVVGLTAAWPLATSHLDEVDVRRALPEVYLRWTLAL